jgi:hypothetical protein
MITPDTIENVSAPNLSGKWLICKVTSGGRWRVVMARGEQAFKESVLRVAKQIGSDEERMFGFSPCEINIVSFPKERVAALAKTIAKLNFSDLKHKVGYNVSKYVECMGKAPPGFSETKPKSGSSVLLEVRRCGSDGSTLNESFWFLGTKNKFCERFKFTEDETLVPREGSPSKAPAPIAGPLFVVANNAWGSELNILRVTWERNQPGVAGSSNHVVCWFQKIKDRPDLEEELVEVHSKELALLYKRYEQEQEEREVSCKADETKRALAFFGER